MRERDEDGDACQDLKLKNPNLSGRKRTENENLQLNLMQRTNGRTRWNIALILFIYGIRCSSFLSC